jgi:hypothetical protein
MGKRPLGFKTYLRDVPFATWRLPIDLKATLHGRGLGLGVNVFAALGRHDSFAGVVLMLQAGKLR